MGEISQEQFANMMDKLGKIDKLITDSKDMILDMGKVINERDKAVNERIDQLEKRIANAICPGNTAS